jgi:hypothetical protein
LFIKEEGVYYIMDNVVRVIAILVSISILFAASVLAAVPNGAQISGVVDNGRFPVPPAGSINLTAGNITRVTLEANMSTFRWVGLYGNASGTFQLGDSSGNALFSWGDAKGRVVYLCRANPTWASLADASVFNVTSSFSFLDGGVADNYTNTFTGAAENIGSGIFSLTSDFATTVSSGGVTTWKTYSITDGTNIIFTGRVSEDGIAYNGETADYQMLIPEDGTGGNEAATEWKIFLELI